MSEIYGLADTSLLETIQTPIGEAMVPRRAVKKKEPGISVTITKMKSSLWMQLIAFLLWTQEKYAQEGLIHGYYKDKPEKGEEHWIIEPPLQEPNGMTVKQISVGEEGEDNRKRFNELEKMGYILRFTAHHHCNTGAFQSGTDREDEHSKPTGFHVTIGELNKPILSFHSRVVVRIPGVIDEEKQTVITEAGTVQFDGDPTMFIETPVDKHLEEYPWLAKARKDFFLHKHQVDFPEEWKEAVCVAPARFQNGTTEENDIAVINATLKKNHLAPFFNEVLALGPEIRMKAWRGCDAPEIRDFNWRGVRTKKRRPLYDAMYRLTNFYSEVIAKDKEFTNDKPIPINIIVEKYLARKKSEITGPTMVGNSIMSYELRAKINKHMITGLDWPAAHQLAIRELQREARENAGNPESESGFHGSDAHMMRMIAPNKPIGTMTEKEYAAWEQEHYGHIKT